MIRTYLVDDHNAVRQAVATMLEASDEIEVVGQAEDTRTALADVAALRPDIVLLDLQLPGSGGMAADIPTVTSMMASERIALLLRSETLCNVLGKLT